MGQIMALNRQCTKPLIIDPDLSIDRRFEGFIAEAYFKFWFLVQELRQSRLYGYNF